MKLYIVKVDYELGNKTAKFIITDKLTEAETYSKKLNNLVDRWVDYYLVNPDRLSAHRRRLYDVMTHSYVQEIEVLTDLKRHLICRPYSLGNLHAMAEFLGIKRCWFHKGKMPHYDIPKGRLSEINEIVTIVSSKEIVQIIKNGK